LRVGRVGENNNQHEDFGFQKVGREVMPGRERMVYQRKWGKTTDFLV
jgi:hypothetical protein